MILARIGKIRIKPTVANQRFVPTGSAMSRGLNLSDGVCDSNNRSNSKTGQFHEMEPYTGGVQGRKKNEVQLMRWIST
jgi:hypothetical protein